MKFSVIIPSFGQAKYLRNTITSALSQTCPAGEFEVIVVDDGSTDGSLEIAKEYEPRIKVIKQINKGLAAARNAGIMNAQGEYCFFLDADDMLLPNALSKIAENISHVFDVIVPSIRCVNEETGQTQDTILMQNPTFDDFKEGNRLAYCAAIKRSVLLEVGGYSSRYDVLGGWEDLALWYDLMGRNKRIYTIQEPLVVYTVKKQSMWLEARNNSAALWTQIVKDFPQTQPHVKP